MIKRYNGSAGTFGDISTIKRYANGQWMDVTIAKRYANGQWIDLLPTATSEPEPTPQQQVKTYALRMSQIYWNGGGQDNQSDTADCLIHGTWTGSTGDSRRSLLWFASQLQSDIAGARIDKVELYLHRESGTHGSGGAGNIYIKTHNYSTKPSTWTGSDSGVADSGTPTLSRGAGAWLTLTNSVGEKLRDGQIQGIALDADSSTSIIDYVRFVRTGTNAPKLKITYTK